MEEIWKRVVDNEARFFFASYLNLANLLNPTPEIVDRLFNAYQADLPRKEDCVDEVERSKIRWALVDDNPKRLLETLHATNRDLCPSIHSIISILLTMPVSSATSDRSFSATRCVKSNCIYTKMCKSTWIWLLMTLLAERIGSLTFHKLMHVKNNE